MDWLMPPEFFNAVSIIFQLVRDVKKQKRTFDEENRDAIALSSLCSRRFKSLKRILTSLRVWRNPSSMMLTFSQLSVEYPLSHPYGLAAPKSPRCTPLERATLLVLRAALPPLGRQSVNGHESTFRLRRLLLVASCSILRASGICSKISARTR